MITRIYSIYDKAAKTYNTPFFMHTDNQAIREMERLVNNPETSMFHHPADYVVFCLGEWNDTECTIDPFDTPEKLCELSALPQDKVDHEIQMCLVDLINKKAADAAKADRLEKEAQQIRDVQ